VATAIEDAIRAYAEDVSEGRFPGVEHTYAMKDEAKSVSPPASQVTKKPKKLST
jgi:hypothetical protein